LDQTENLKAAKKALKGVAGVYAFIYNITGTVYIGSSINIAQRLVDHAVDNDTNVRLQNAITKLFPPVTSLIERLDPPLGMGCRTPAGVRRPVFSDL